jgi:hypothetical protein
MGLRQSNGLIDRHKGVGRRSLVRLPLMGCADLSGVRVRARQQQLGTVVSMGGHKGHGGGFNGLLGHGLPWSRGCISMGATR